jgi:hypothetical protein
MGEGQHAAYPIGALVQLTRDLEMHHGGTAPRGTVGTVVDHYEDGRAVFNFPSWGVHTFACGVEHLRAVIDVIGMTPETELATLRAEVERLRQEHEELGLGSGPHNAPTDCPTFFDHCHCTVENLLFNIERAEKAEAEVERLRDLLGQREREHNRSASESDDRIFALEKQNERLREAGKRIVARFQQLYHTEYVDAALCCAVEDMETAIAKARGTNAE